MHSNTRSSDRQPNKKNIRNVIELP